MDQFTVAPKPRVHSLVGEYNGLNAITVRAETFGQRLVGVRGYAVDTLQQVNTVYRSWAEPGTDEIGPQLWGQPGRLPGSYLFPTTPACAISADASGAVWIGNVIPAAIGTDQACYVDINGLVNLGGSFSFSPVMTSWPGGRVDVFGLNAQGRVLQRTMLDGNFNWTPGWNDIGYFPAQRLAAAIACSGSLIDVIARDVEDRLLLLSWNGSAWVGATDLDFVSSADPALASCADGRLDILALNEGDGGLYHQWRTVAGWSGWELVGWTNATWAKPAVDSWGPNRLDVVCVGSDNALYHKWYDGAAWYPSGPGNWDPMGGMLTMAVAPVIAAPMPGWIEAFAKSATGEWCTNSYDGASWAGWVGHGVYLG